LVNYLGIFSSGYQADIGTGGLELPRLLGNSVITGLSSTALALALAIPGGYVMARFRLRINAWVLGFMLFTRMLPPMSLALPLFLISHQIDLYDNVLLLIIVYAAVNLPFDQYLLIGFFRAVPVEIEEAGLIDGLTRFGCLRRLVLPLILPGLAATAILTLWVTWTDYQFALILTSSAATTMPVGISALVSQYGQLWGVFGAAGVTYSVPVVAFCLFAQRYLVSGLTMGSIK
jgi:multiple sugar transport system permease protein